MPVGLRTRLLLHTLANDILVSLEDTPQLVLFVSLLALKTTCCISVILTFPMSLLLSFLASTEIRRGG